MPESPVQAARRPPITSVLRHRNYRLFFAGQLLSQMGSWMAIIGQAWLVYRLTGSSLALGLIGFLQQGPVFFLSALGGTFADRVDRRRLLIVSQSLFLVQASTLALLTFTGVVQLWHVAALAFLFGLINSADIPTRQSFTVEMVGKEDLQSAVALNSILFNIARVVGPAVAGVTIAAVGEAWCFAINAVSFLAVLASLAFMRTTPFVRGERARPIQDLVEGFNYVRHHQEIRTALLALALTSFAGGPYLTLMPVFAEQVLGADSRGYGLLMTMVGAGALCGAFVMGRMRQGALKAAPSVAAVGFGLALVSLSMARDFTVAAMLILPAAFFLMLQGAATNILVQLMVEDRMRGRVMAYYTMAFLGMMPFGSLTAGAVAHYLHVPMTWMLGGIVCALGGVSALWLRKTRDD